MSPNRIPVKSTIWPSSEQSWKILSQIIFLECVFLSASRLPLVIKASFQNSEFQQANWENDEIQASLPRGKTGLENS